MSFYNGQWYCDKCGYSHSKQDPCRTSSSAGTGPALIVESQLKDHGPDGHNVTNGQHSALRMHLHEAQNKMADYVEEIIQLKKQVESWKGAHSVASVDRDIAQAQVVELRKIAKTINHSYCYAEIEAGYWAQWCKQFPILKGGEDE